MKTFRVYTIIILVAIIIALYTFEGYIRITNSKKTSEINNSNFLKEKIYKEKTGKQYDFRTNVQIAEYFLNKGENITIPFLPHHLRSSSNLDLFHLSGPSNSKIICCNENGYWSIIDTDKYGFNNPGGVWKKSEIEFVLVGDSFTFGDCVNRPNDIPSVLRNLTGKAVINLGYRGNGPLMEYATLKEYFPEQSNVKNILWLYYEGNDNYEFTLELKNNILKKYFEDKNFSQNLKNKQQQIDIITKIPLAEVKEKKDRSKNQNNFKKQQNISVEVIEFLKLKKTRAGLRENSKPRPQFKTLLKLTLEFAKQNNSNFYFVYLPEYERYILSNYKQKNYKKIKRITKDLNIPFIDIHKEVFAKEKNPLKLFPFELPGHYNTYGYKKVAENIFKNTQR